MVEANIYEKGTAILGGLLQKRGASGFIPIGLAGVIAGIFLSLAAVHTLPNTAPYALGQDYARLSLNPFATETVNRIPLRIAFPLVAWALGISGNNIALLAYIFTWGLLFLLVYGSYRLGLTFRQAIICAAAIAFTIPIQFSLAYAGYPDSFVYFLALLMLFSVGIPHIYWLLFALALFTHETVVFLAPFFLLYRFRFVCEAPFRWLLREVLPALTLTLGGYLLYRVSVVSQSQALGAVYSLGYYVNPILKDPLYWLREANLIGTALLPAGIFGAFRFVWVIWAFALYQWLRERAWLRVLEAFLLLAGAFAQLFLAVDTTRLLGIMFLSIVLASWSTATIPGGTKVSVVAVALTLLPPPIYVINGDMRWFLGLPWLVIGPMVQNLGIVVREPCLFSCTDWGLAVFMKGILASLLLALGIIAFFRFLAFHGGMPTIVKPAVVERV